MTFALLCAGPAMAIDWLYTVRPGDTLWDFSETYLRDVSYWQRVQALNKVPDPWNLPPGMRLRVPVSWMRQEPVPVRVVAVGGPAEVSRSGSGTGVAIAVDMLLRAADEVRTGRDGTVTLEFADGAQMLVAPNSRLVLDLLSVNAGAAFIDTRLRLLEGRSSVRAPSTPGQQFHYEISTPAATSSVRGTDFRVGIEAGGNAMVAETLTGQVDVSARGRTVAVPRGFGTRVDRGALPRPPVPLLPAPDLAPAPAVLERIPIRFRIAALAGASAYRVEIARDPAFSSLLVDQIFPSPLFSGIILADGSYFVRVRGIDPLGIEGFDSVKTVVVNARPEPPLLMEPIKDAVIPSGSPMFIWTEVEDARAYRIQIARDGDFARSLTDIEDYRRNRFTLTDALPPGLFAWRVATIDAGGDEGGDEGPYSDAQEFRVPEPGPTPAPPEIEKETLLFRWRAGLPEDRYRLQMGKDAAFQQVLFDEVSDQSFIKVPRPLPGDYFIRVKTIEAAGTEGPYGETQKISIQPDQYWMLSIPILMIILAFVL